MTWHDEAPRGKLDLLVTMDFRMTSTTLFSDVVLPAATWYEKHDLSSTDMHPFIHSFSPAIDPPWQCRTDFATFHTIAQVFSRLAETHLGVREDLVASPLAHDTADEMAMPHGTVPDPGKGPTERDLGPGVTMPKLTVVERDYPARPTRGLAAGARCALCRTVPPRMARCSLKTESAKMAATPRDSRRSCSIWLRLGHGAWACQAVRWVGWIMCWRSCPKPVAL